MKPKFNINRKKLTDAEIDNYQNFDKLMQQYTVIAKPFYQTKWFWGGAGGIAVVSVIVYVYMYLYTYKSSETVQKANDSVAIANIEQAFINPPLHDINVPFNSYRLDASKGGEITYVTGSKLIIPPFCFADSNGNLISAQVEIRYREFHDVVDFFISGIPMTYDSAGTSYTFESAGMMEIQGYLNNRPVQIAEGKMIDVKMHSNYKGTHYNLYYLDTLKKNWSYLGKDKVSGQRASKVSSSEVSKVSSEKVSGDFAYNPETSETIETFKTPADEKLEALKKQAMPVEPAKPKKAKEENYRFNIDVNTNEFPELSIYKDVLFEIHPKHKDFDPELYEIQWEDALLKKLSGDNTYELSLIKGEMKKVFGVYPVFEGKQYEEAKKVYDKKFEEYSLTLENRKAEEKRLKAEAEKQRQEALAKWEAQKKAWEEQQKKEMEAMLAVGQVANAVTREFSISGFGIYNCDSPQLWPKGAELSPCTLVDQNGNAVFQNENNAYIYAFPLLAEKNRNAMFTMGKTVTFNPKAENILWCALPGGKLGVFSSEDFKQINQTSGSYTFKMNVVEVKSKEEIKSVLGI